MDVSSLNIVGSEGGRIHFGCVSQAFQAYFVNHFCSCCRVDERMDEG